MKYTYKRPVVGFYGTKEVKVTIRECPDHEDEKSKILDDTKSNIILIPHCRADLNLTILIGLLRWRIGMKREHVKWFLMTKGIEISEGAISDRSLDFLLLFKALHTSRQEKLKAMFRRVGGIILHVDGTHKSGGRVVFVLMDGIHDIILDADLIASESVDDINPILSVFKANFGDPLVIVRDMGLGVETCVTLIFPGKPQQICQVHFLRDLEKDLITRYHKGLKSSIVKHTFTSKLRKLRDCKAPVHPFLALQHRWVLIAIDYLLDPVIKHPKWLSRPVAYYLQYLRVKEISDCVTRLFRQNAKRNLLCTSIEKLSGFLKALLEDSKVLDAYHFLDQTIKWLEEAREELRISRHGHLKANPVASAAGDTDGDTEVDIAFVKKEVEEFLDRIGAEGKKLDGKYSKISTHIIDAFRTHWDELFVPDPIVNGKHLSLKRHNNNLESSHRRIRKGIRERTGKSETKEEMEQFGDLLAIVSNLWNETYQSEILDDMNDLCSALRPFLTKLPQLRTEYRKARAGPEVPIRDSKRLGILTSFVEAYESMESEEVSFSRLQTILGIESDCVGVCGV